MQDWQSLFGSTHVPEWQIGLRLTAALVLGGLVGLDREAKNRPAGLRTHMLISLAAAVFAILTLEMSEFARANEIESDPLRAIEAVTAGVAFLAAGTIIQGRGRVSGLTTGASMWLAGAIGVSAGFGMLGIAIAATVAALIVLVGLQRLSQRINPEDE
jgi:putative Mg2+ transporter-C (MgtC) family protein